jgi:tetratricopeptide (TPR) repeat protein
MEGRRQLDAAGSSPAGCALKRGPAVCVLLACGCLASYAQSAPATPDLLERIKQLSAQAQWQDVVNLSEASGIATHHSAELDYYCGMALARLGRFDEAARALQAGIRLNPDDVRFPLELAGIAFKQKNYSRAAAHLRRALKLNPADAYANEFLATVYFLQGNLEAALKYWNRIGKPRIENVLTDPKPRVDPVLLDRAFVFAPASNLRLAELVTTEKRIGGLGIFPTYRFELAAREDSKFDAIFRSQERNGWGSNAIQALVGFFRGLPYQTVYPEYFNIGNRAVNSQSMVRWDAQKRRLDASLSGPLHRNPKWRYRLGTDLRNENWDIRNSFTGPAPLLGALNLRREAVSAEITSFPDDRLTWSIGAELSHRDFRNVDLGVSLAPGLLLKGFQLKQAAKLSYDLWRMPDRRFTLRGGASSELARIWSQPAQVFEKLEGTVAGQWFPQARGEDYETTSRIRAGRTFGSAPFDELFMLGIERDNDLWLRAHIGTRDGRKGSAPLGRNYSLGSWETDKIIYQNGFVTFRIGPFVDSGKITDSYSGLGSHKWLWDTGVQAKVRVLGVGVGVSYCKDLRSGNNAVYTTVGR